jgi:hypothetical protein
MYLFAPFICYPVFGNRVGIRVGSVENDSMEVSGSAAAGLLYSGSFRLIVGLVNKLSAVPV